MELNRSTEISFPWSGRSLGRQIRSVSPRTWLLPCIPPTEQLARVWLGGAGFSHGSLSSARLCIEAGIWPPYLPRRLVGLHFAICCENSLKVVLKASCNL